MLFPEDSEDGTLEDGFTTHSSSFERIHNYEGDMEVQVSREREGEKINTHVHIHVHVQYMHLTYTKSMTYLL